MVDDENQVQEFELQRWDAHWGGWRAVRKSFFDDSPARFADKDAAERAMTSMPPQDKYRIHHLAPPT